MARRGQADPRRCQRNRVADAQAADRPAARRGRLAAAGESRRPADAYRTEEEETANGPADYALWLDGRIVGIVEAKKLTLGPQNVLTQAERYARGLAAGSPFDFDGLRVPVPLLHERRGDLVPRRPPRAEPLAAGRRRSTPQRAARAARPRLDAALRDAPGDCRTTTRGCGRTSSRPTPLSRRRSPSASATCWSPWPPGTGKTFTLVNQIYRLMKSGVGQAHPLPRRPPRPRGPGRARLRLLRGRAGPEVRQDLRGLQPALPARGLRRGRAVRPEGPAAAST